MVRGRGQGRLEGARRRWGQRLARTTGPCAVERRREPLSAPRLGRVPAPPGGEDGASGD